MNAVIVEDNLLNLEATDKFAVIHKLADKLAQKGIVINPKDFVQAVFNRESEITTGVGNGIAVPHGKSENVTSSTVIFAKLREPVDWDSIDGKPVDMVFLLAIAGADQGDGHLQTLASLAGRLMDEQFVESIRNTNDATKIMELIAQ